MSKEKIISSGPKGLARFKRKKRLLKKSTEESKSLSKVKKASTKKETFEIKKVSTDIPKRKLAITQEKFKDSSFFMDASSSIDKSKILVPKNLEQTLENALVKFEKPKKQMDYLMAQDEEEKMKYAAMNIKGPSEKFNPMDKTSGQREKEFRDQSMYTNLRNESEQLTTLRKTERDPNYIPRPIKKPEEKQDPLKRVKDISQDYIH